MHFSVITTAGEPRLDCPRRDYCGRTGTAGLFLGRYNTPSLKNQKTLAFTTYSNADWGDGVNTGRSTSGHVLMMSAFANRSRLEKPVATSSCESEAIAMCGCVQEIYFYRDFLNELKLCDPNVATTLYVDNRSAVLDAHNTTVRRTRHIYLVSTVCAHRSARRQ